MVRATDSTTILAVLALVSIACALIGRGLVTQRRETWRACLLLTARLLLGASLAGSVFVVAEAITLLQRGVSMRSANLLPLFFHVVPVQIVAVVTAASSRPRPLFLTATILAVLVGGLRYFLEVASNYFVSMCEYGADHIARDRVLEESVGALNEARIVAVALAVIALAHTFVSKSKPDSKANQSSLAVAALVFTLGLVAFTLTRPHASDADRALRFWRCTRCVSPGVQTPPAEPDADCMWEAPHLRFGPDGATLDGEALQDPEALQPHIRQWSLEHANMPPRALIVADPTMPRDTLEPWLDVLRDGGVLLFAGSWSDHPHASETLGLIRRGRLVGWRIDAKPESPGDTWGELAHATHVAWHHQ